ncbi:MAG: SH3 domain-containing protein [Clostridia bacterium]
MTLTKNNKIIKYIASFLAVVILFSCFPVYQAEAASTTGYTTANVNLRKGAGTSYSVIEVVAKGSTITITDTSNSTWYKVTSSSGNSGYMHSDYIQVSSTSSSSSFNAKVVSNVNFRTGPSTSYSIITGLSTGTVVEVLSTANSNWYYIKTSDGTTGYVYYTYLTQTTDDLTSSDTSTGTYNVKVVSNVNFRTGPSTSYSIITGLSTGTVVQVLDDSNSKWYYVQTSEGTQGYVYYSYVTNTSDDLTSSDSSSTSTYNAKVVDDVNFRKGPSTSYTILDELLTGTVVEVLDDSNSKWYYVKTADGVTGYVYYTYLTQTTDSVTTVTPPDYSSEHNATTTANVNLRSGKGTSYSIIKVVAKSTRITVLDTSNSTWYKVQLTDGTTGYIHSSYITVDVAVTATPTPTATATATPTATPTATATATPTPTVEGYSAKVISGVNFRSGKGTSYSIISVISTGTIVTVTDDSSSWYAVTLSDGTSGYVYYTYLTATTDSDSTDSTEYLITTASSGLNLRTSASTSSTVLKVLSKGTVVTLLEKTSSSWYKVETSDGTVGYVSADYVSDYSPSTTAGTVTISASSKSISKYETLYLTASATNGSSVTWSSSDETVATVSGGFVYAVSQGTATITATDSSGTSTATCKVTVTDADNIRFAYSQENTPVSGETFNLAAVTDTEKTGIKFVISNGETLTTTTYTTESQTSTGLATNEVKIFTASLTLTEGEYTVKAYSKIGDSYSSDYYEFTVKVENGTQSSSESRLVSSEMISIIAGFEGFSATVYADTLANGIPTVGYGYVINENETFYNNLTATEAMAMLVDTVNQGAYTSAVNSMISKNNLLVTQAQFDAMVSFSYNVGTAWTSSSTLRSVLLTAVDYSSLNISTSNSYKGTTISSTGVYSSNSTSSTAIVSSLASGTSVTVTGYTRDESTGETWYQITSSSFTETGWIRAGYVTLDDYTGSHDLTYVDSMAFAFKILEWHVAGGECLPGLLYRRLAEAKIFLYENYEEASSSNSNYKVNTYDFVYPSCMSQYQ